MNLTQLLLVALAALSIAVPSRISAATPPGNGENSCAAAFSFLAHPEGGMSREKIISKYLHMPFKSPAENAVYIKSVSEETQPAGTLAVHVELSNLQSLNKLTNDKNLVTSIHNKHKELWFDAMEDLERRYKGKLIIPSYSDFKSGRQAISPKPPATDLPPGFQKKLDKLFADANIEFSDFVKKSGLNVDGHVENWFRGGTGKTADIAEVVARLSRDISGPNVLRHGEDGLIIQAADVYRGWAEVFRQGVRDNPSYHNLMNGEWVKPNVLDMVKKTPDVSEIRKRLIDVYGAHLDNDQILKLQNYNDMIDYYSLGPRIEERVIATLEKADKGGYSADGSGLSARNRDSAARSIANGKNFEDTVRLSRKGEQEITKKFKKENEAFTAILDKFFEKKPPSGDDFAAPALEVVGKKQKRQIMNEVAELPRPANWRIAFISDNVRTRDRNIMGAHGEAIEKILRRKLEGKVSIEKLEFVFFGVDMGGKQAGTGSAELLIGAGKRSGLNKADRDTIKAAFKDAVEEFNLPTEAEPDVKNYVAR